MQTDFIKSSAPEAWDLQGTGSAAGAGGGSSSAGSAVNTQDTSQNFAGFTDIGSGFEGGNVLFRNSGYLRLGQGDNSVIFDANDALYRVAVGSETYATAPFRVQKDGKFHAGSASQYIDWDGTKLTIAGDVVQIDTSTGAVKGSLQNVISLTAGETISGTTLPVAVFLQDSDNEVYACDANDTSKLDFIGFAITNGTDGNAITIQTDGVVSGFTGLTYGAKYYVQDDKTIGVTPGTYEILVGQAVSTTTLIIIKQQRDIGVFGDGSDGDATITTETTLSADKFYNKLTLSSGTPTNTTITRTANETGYGQSSMDSASASGWSLIRKLTGLGATSNTPWAEIQARSAGNNGEWAEIRRGYATFSLSTIPKFSDVTAVTLKLYITSKTTTLASQSVSIIGRRPPVRTADGEGTFDKNDWDFTSKLASDVTLASITTGAYNDFALNATGIAYVEQELRERGKVCLGICITSDVDNSEPTWVASAIADVVVSNTAAQEAKLYVEYTPIGSLYTGGYRVFVRDTLTIGSGASVNANGNRGGDGMNAWSNSGAYNNAGGDGGVAGTVIATGSIYGGAATGAGGAGGNGASGSQGVAGTVGETPSNIAKVIGVSGVNGAAGATGGANVAGTAGAAGGAAGAGATGTGTAYNKPRTITPAYNLVDFSPSLDFLRSSCGTGGSGGGGGGRGTTFVSGGGGGGGGAGSPGGLCSIFARKIINNGTISSNGGDGGDGGSGGNAQYDQATTNAGGGGGGAGGSGGCGGVVILAFSEIINNGTISVTGGSAGTGATGGIGFNGRLEGNAGQLGGTGANGTAGSTGVIYKIQV